MRSLRELKAEWRFENHLLKQDGKKPLTFLRFLWEELKERNAYRVCKIAGHDLVNDDPGDPEVGPQPNVYCTRCGIEY